MRDLQRLVHIDILKSLGIISVVYLHSCLEANLFIKYIGSFHMVLFFVLSGYCYNCEKYKSFKNLFTKKFVTLMIPFLFWEKLIRIPIEILRVIVLNKEVKIDVIVDTFMYWLKYGTWFLWTLFIVYILAWCILRLCSVNGKYKLYQIIILSIILFLTKNMNARIIFFANIKMFY